ncbi:MAG: MBL fold metallo-hydrolase [Candidatus Riflebacteria bacterium]
MNTNLPEIIWLGHASLQIKTSIGNFFIDPWKITGKSKASAVLVTHGHFDHLSPDDIKKLLEPGKPLIAPPDCLKDLQQYDCHAIKPDQTLIFADWSVTGIAAYNPDKEFHPKNNNWVGYLLEIDGTRIYVAGDSDLTPEMQKVKADIVILPVGGTYTMNYQDAAQAVRKIKPRLAIPIHFGDIVGEPEDGRKFAAELKDFQVKILQPKQVEP